MLLQRPQSRSCHDDRVSDTLNPAVIHLSIPLAMLAEVDARVDDLWLNAPPSLACARTGSEVLPRERVGGVTLINGGKSAEHAQAVHANTGGGAESIRSGDGLHGDGCVFCQRPFVAFRPSLSATTSGTPSLLAPLSSLPCPVLHLCFVPVCTAWCHPTGGCTFLVENMANSVRISSRP
jgi:hypothetical protein